MSAGSVLDPAGPAAARAAEAAWLLLGGGALVFVLVMALLAWVVARRRGDAAGAPARVAPAAWIVGGGVVFPAVVLVSLFAYQELRLPAEASPGDPLIVSVTARMWWWEVRYRDPSSGREIALANEIHLPAGRPVVIGLNSADVIHSFWVPALAGKVDMIPGRVTQLRVEAARPGRYQGPCAEFCGDQHARMALEVVVEEPAAFARWLEAEARPAAPPRGGSAERGLAVFTGERCTACHAVRGVAEGSSDGPDLTHVASRRRIGAGTLPADAAGLARWVSSVQHVKPGARMPSYERIDPESLAALAAFLAGLR